MPQLFTPVKCEAGEIKSISWIISALSPGIKAHLWSVNITPAPCWTTEACCDGPFVREQQPLVWVQIRRNILETTVSLQLLLLSPLGNCGDKYNVCIYVSTNMSAYTYIYLHCDLFDLSN